MIAGDVVELREPLPDEVGLQFVVIEPRGDRALVRALNVDFSLPILEVYSIAELQKVCTP